MSVRNRSQTANRPRPSAPSASLPLDRQSFRRVEFTSQKAQIDASGEPEEVGYSVERMTRGEIQIARTGSYTQFLGIMREDIPSLIDALESVARYDDYWNNRAMAALDALEDDDSA